MHVYASKYGVMLDPKYALVCEALRIHAYALLYTFMHTSGYAAKLRCVPYVLVCIVMLLLCFILHICYEYAPSPLGWYMQ
jgi:hypothetical protein